MALNPLVSLIGRLVARSGRKRGTDGQNDKLSTVTLAAHARRGLIIPSSRMLFLLRKRPGAVYHDKTRDEDEEDSRDIIPTTEEEAEETEALLKGESPPSHSSHNQQQGFGEEEGQPYW